MKSLQYGTCRLLVAAMSLGALMVHCPAQEKEKETKASFEGFALTSSGGFTGRGSGKALAIEKDGKFVVKTRTDQKQGKLQSDELTRLRTLVVGVKWKEIARNYRGNGADFFQDDLSATIAGKKHQTHVSEDAERRKLPVELRELLEFGNKLYAKYRPAPAKK